jgi:hypothetical protein
VKILVGLDESVLPDGENFVGAPSVDKVRWGPETSSGPGIGGLKESS